MTNKVPPRNGVIYEKLTFSRPIQKFPYIPEFHPGSQFSFNTTDP